MENITLSQFKALLYADVFEYPLTKQELEKFKIQSSNIKTNSKLKTQNIEKGVNTNGYYYFLKGREKSIKLRQQREGYSREKFIIAQRAVQFLRIIPSIQMIAVTGALAMNNATDNDDIDLLIVTAKNRIWTTRLLSIIILEIAGLRRRPNDKRWNNKICLNMFVDEKHLAVPKHERDLFTVHEAAQIKVLFDRGGVKERWWRENRWISSYLPKFKAQNSNVKSSSKLKTQNNNLLIWILDFICHLSFIICHFGENASRKVQLSYMKSKRTTEVVEDGYLRFHPHDARGRVMREYSKRLRKYGLE